MKRILFPLLGISLNAAASSLPNECPPASAFSHEAPGLSWQVNVGGWIFDQGGSQQSTLTNIPNDAVSYVFIIPGQSGSVQCTYSENLHDQGILNFDLIRATSINKEEIPTQFSPSGKGYKCYFVAGNPSTCAWK
ncbi:hypothetical protein ACQUW5_04520 [Legionella sp. CNM-1927-20]|uniref:hypothetical protein n=1 Tax=Legionella sp. CNM-1927-20 TaxID=3422221 RepID=UPI00403A9517